MCLWSLLISRGFLPLPDYTDYNPLPTVSPLLAIGGGNDRSAVYYNNIYVHDKIYNNIKNMIKDIRSILMFTLITIPSLMFRPSLSLVGAATNCIVFGLYIVYISYTQII